jgi:hypothetical protein
MNPVALSCTAVLGLLLFGLGLAVSLTRVHTKTVTGLSSDPADWLNKMARAHTNTAEFAPFLALLFLYFGMHQPSTTTLALIVAATLCRCLIVIGLIAPPTMASPHPVRAVGALGTYACGLALSATLFV